MISDFELCNDFVEYQEKINDGEYYPEILADALQDFLGYLRKQGANINIEVKKITSFKGPYRKASNENKSNV